MSKKTDNANGKKHVTPQSLNAAVKSICDIMRRSNVAGAMNYVPELTWILFLRILDEREAREAEEAEALGLSFTPSLTTPCRWQDWAAPDSALRKDTKASVWAFVHEKLLPHLKGLKKKSDATPRQKVISEVMSGVERSRIDSEKNFCDVLDKVHELSNQTVDPTHVFTLSQVYEGLLLKMGEKGNDGDLFKGAPQFFDVLLMNPPFGGKEGKEAQTQFDYKTGATQVLFLQHVLKSMKTGSRCGIVLDEGVLFRTNETAFVQTKRKLLEECDVYCIVSLPGGVFSSAGAGVKTNLVFFTKGKPTETIWYYDLSAVKVGKKTPLTLAHFGEFFKLLSARGDSAYGWTVNFAARLQQALEEARPHREKAAELFTQAKAMEDEWRERRRAKAVNELEQAAREEKWKAVEREARESLAKGEAIEDAVYDLKAVNPNRASEQDTRTPTQLLDFITQKGRDADAALGRLRKLVNLNPALELEETTDEHG